MLLSSLLDGLLMGARYRSVVLLMMCLMMGADRRLRGVCREDLVLRVRRLCVLLCVCGSWSGSLRGRFALTVVLLGLRVTVKMASRRSQERG